MSSFFIYALYVIIPATYFWAYVFPTHALFAYGFAALATSSLVWYLVWASNVKRQVRFLFLRFVLSPLFLLTASFFNFLLLEHLLLAIAYPIVIAFLQVLMLEHIYFFLYRTDKYETYSLGRIFSYTNLLTLFFFFSGFYSLSFFLHLPVWMFVLATFLVVLILTWQIFWISAFDMKKSWIYTLIISVIITELFGMLFFLPLGFYTLAIIVFVAYYAMLRLTRQALFGNLEANYMRRYAWTFILLTLAVLLTSKWT